MLYANALFVYSCTLSGAFLLDRLLTKYPRAPVYCIARAKTPTAATERVVKALRTHLLWKEEYAVCDSEHVFFTVNCLRVYVLFLKK